MFSFTVPNKVNDYVNFKIYDAMRKEPGKVLIMPIFMGVFALIMILMRSYAFAGLCLGFAALFPVLSFVLAATSGKSLRKQHPDYEKNSFNYRVERTVIYIAENDSKHTPIKYTDLYCAVETKDYFYLYETHETSFIIPKSCMNEKDAVTFGRILEINLKPYRKFARKR